MKNSGKKKVNKMIYVAIGVVVIAAIIAVPRIIKNETNKHILDGPVMINTLSWNLTGVSYACGGGMEGGSHSMSITYADEDKYIYDYYNCPYNGAEEETLNIEVSDYTFSVFREICNSTQCLIKNEGTPSEYQLLDAPSTSIVFTLDDGSTVSFSDSYEYPPNCDGIFTKVYDALFRIYEENNIVTE